MTEDQDKQLENLLNEHLTNARNDGIVVGARMVASAIHAIATEKGKPYNKRINKIKEFCETILKKSVMNGEETTE